MCGEIQCFIHLYLYRYGILGNIVEEYIWECNIWGIHILGSASSDLIGISQLPATLCDIRGVIPSVSILTLLHHLTLPAT